LFDLPTLAQQADGQTYLKPDDGKCLRYYFYFIDDELGLTYVRVPTWLPCQLQIYFNGHNWLAVQLRKRIVPFTRWRQWLNATSSPAVMLTPGNST
jgi:hypothetical protein